MVAVYSQKTTEQNVGQLIVDSFGLLPGPNTPPTLAGGCFFVCVLFVKKKPRGFCEPAFLYKFIVMDRDIYFQINIFCKTKGRGVERSRISKVIKFLLCI